METIYEVAIQVTADGGRTGGGTEGVRVGFLVYLKEEPPELTSGGDRCVGDEELLGTQRTN